MDLIWEKFTEWLKELLVGGIMDNLTGLFDNVNAKVAEAAGHIGSTPQAWNANIYSMIRSLSDNLILPIAGVILAFVMTLELIQLITDKNNLNDMDPILGEAEKEAHAHYHIQEDDVARHEGISLMEVTALLQPQIGRAHV